VIAVLAAITVVGAVLVSTLSGRRPRPRVESMPAATAPAPQPKSAFHVPVVTEPPGASVLAAEDHTLLCAPTPCEFEIARERAAFAMVSLELPGHLPVLARVSDVTDVPGGTLMLTFGRSPTPSPYVRPTLRELGVQIHGPLPVDVVRRIVRQHFGRFRLCYENALRLHPGLEGRVTTRFVIDTRGAVSTASDAGSDLPDQGVVHCVVSSFGSLTFPENDQKKVVTVVYPIGFASASGPSM